MTSDNNIKRRKNKNKKMKKGVDFLKSECYYKQAVADKTAKNTIRHHSMESKKSKEIKKSS